MKRMEIEEVHSHALGIAKALDSICTSHSIPYYMLGGTMLGAIRHKGFIPWDDDMDFGVPIEYYKELEELLVNELPYPYRCCIYRNHPAAMDNFIKIEDRTTCIDDTAIGLPLDDQLGINIDVFPLNRCTKDSKLRLKIWRRRVLLSAFFNSKSKPRSLIRRIGKKSLQLVLGGKPIFLQKSIDRLLFQSNEGDCFVNYMGRYGEKEIMPIDWFGDGERYVFEDTTFVGPSSYHSFLTHLYGDYMKMPSEEKRIPHVANIYLR